jgi:hypothetical protein
MKAHSNLTFNKEKISFTEQGSFYRIILIDQYGTGPSQILV